MSWPAQLRRMPGYRIYALDLPGHGKSGGVGRQSIMAYADAVADWFSSMGLTRANLIGHSMGSAIALTLAVDHPETARSMVLIGAGARLQVNPRLLEEYGSQTTFLSAIEKTVMWSFSEETPRKMVEQVQRRMAETRQGVLYGDFMACADFDISERLAEIRQPVLVISGEQDKMTPSRHAQFLADHIDGATMKLIAHAGHMVMLEQPEAVAQEVCNFLAQVQ